MKTTMDSQKTFCTFHVEDLYFGVEVSKVQEVIRYQRMTRVPGAPSVIQGLINLRGQLVTAIDLRQKLELPYAKPESKPMNVVIRDGEEAVSLLVDEIGDVLVVSDDQFESTPETLRGAPREMTMGVYKLDHQLLLVLDCNAVLNIVSSQQKTHSPSTTASSNGSALTN